eukprot:2294664-Prymnesium_polylepis.2
MYVSPTLGLALPLGRAYLAWIRGDRERESSLRHETAEPQPHWGLLEFASRKSRKETSVGRI